MSDLEKKKQKAKKEKVPTLATKKKQNVNKKTKKKKPSIPKVKKSLETDAVASDDIDTLEFDRPKFSSAKEKAARLEAALATDDDYYIDANLDIKHADLAAPHRAPYSKLRDLVLNGSEADVEDVVGILTEASETCETAFRKVTSNSRYSDLADLYEQTRLDVENALANYKVPTLDKKNKYISKLDLIKALNDLASNAPGLGPHSGTNAPVSDRLHLHLTDLQDEPVTPRGKAANKGFPYEPVATVTDTSGETKIVSVTGAHHSLQPGQYVPYNEDVSVKTRVLRGALFVDESGTVHKPIKPKDDQ